LSQWFERAGSDEFAMNEFAMTTDPAAGTSFLTLCEPAAQRNKPPPF
jgi:hypothetical protein